jgi:thioredoxin-like negative regulator of GroEL
MKSLIKKLIAKPTPEATTEANAFGHEALSQYEAILRKDPRNLEALIQSAALLLEMGRIDEFRRQLESATRFHPDNLTLRKLGIRAEARSLASAQRTLENWRQVLAEHPDDLEAKLGIASALLVAEQYDETIAFLTEHDAQLKTVVGAALIRARCYTRQNVVEKIPGAWQGVIAVDPKPAEPYLALVNFFLNEERFEECAHWVKVGQEKFPRSPALCLLQARLGLRKQDDAMAEAGFLAAFERDAKNVEACIGLTNLYLKREVLDEAEKWAALAASLAPQDVRALTARARALHGLAKNARV